MELKELMKEIQKDVIQRGTLPMEQGMLYPAFSICRGKLCVHILSHRTAVKPEGLRIWPPEFYLQYSYPEVKPLAMANLKYSVLGKSTDFTAWAVIPVRTPEDKERSRENLKKLIELGSQLLKSWVETGTADPEAYQQQLAKVLEPAQWEMYAHLLGTL